MNFFDDFTPVDLEIYERQSEDFPESAPIKPMFIKLNGQALLTSAEPGEAVYVHPLLGDTATRGCFRVTLTLFVQTLKVHCDRSLPSGKGTASVLLPGPGYVDLHNASAGEINAALAERGWRLATDTE